MKTLALSMRLTLYAGETYTEKRDSLSLDWNTFLSQNLPDAPFVFLPNIGTDIHKVLKSINLGGIILTGGDDIGAYTQRDTTEEACIDYAIQNKIPLIGICRGAQMIQHYFGGKLSAINNHAGTTHRIDWIHQTFSANMYLSKISNQSFPSEANSYHCFGITEEDLVNECSSFALSYEGGKYFSEGFIHNSLPIVGLMWHPERLSNELMDTFTVNLLKSCMDYPNV